MQFRLLGPLEVAEQNMAAALGGVELRSSLAILLLDANEVVATDRLIGELWGESPPAPTVLVRRRAGQAGLAPDDPVTRFRWSLTGARS